MNTDIFIKKPVFSIVINLVLVRIGLLSFSQLTVRQYPDVTPTVITVQTAQVGASAQDVESFITTPIESQLSGIKGLDLTESISSQGLSSITLRFETGTDLNEALSHVNSQVQAARYQLPDEAEPPVVQQTDSNSQPIMWLSVTSLSKNRSDLTHYFINQVQPQLQNIPGVSKAQLFGRRDYAIRIHLNPISIWAHQLSFNEVIQTLKLNNTYPPLGTLEGPLTQYTTQLTHTLFSPEHFGQIVLSNHHHQRVQLKDVARLSWSSKDLNSAPEFEGKPAIFIGIFGTSKANPIEVAQATQDQLKTIKSTLDSDMKIHTVWDSSKFIRASIQDLTHTLFEAILAVTVITLLFLGSLRAVLIPTIAIPISLIGTLTAQLILGYSINSFTLLAMVLAVGMVVDDAIVVLENIHRYIEEGDSPQTAALKGVRQIRFAVIAMTLTLASVYTPIGFIRDNAGRLFQEFAFTLAFSVILSGFVALTLSPMLCSKVLRHENTTLSLRVESLFKSLAVHYGRYLNTIITYKKSCIILMLFMFSGCAALFMFLPKALIPQEDVGAILTFVTAPESSNLKYTQAQTKAVQAIQQSLPEKEHFGIVNGFQGTHSALGILTLKPWGERPPIQQLIMKKVLPQMMKIPGIIAFPMNPFRVPGSESGMPVNFVVKGHVEFDELSHRMERMISYIKDKYPYFLNPKSSVQLNQSELKFKIDREAASDLNVDTAQIGQALYYALGEGVVGHFVFDHRSYDVLSQIDADHRSTSQGLSSIPIRTRQGQLIPLSSLLTAQRSIGAPSLPHFEQMRSATLSLLPVPGFPLGKAIDQVVNVAEQFFPKNQFMYDFGGESREYIAAQGHLLPLFVYALVFIYLVLSAQYESFRDPIIIMLTVPLSTLGALIALLITGSTLNLYTNIGILTLVGLISKHGILMVDFANDLKSKGLSCIEAITQAAQTRLRPILATTAAMLLSAFPLAWASGAGAVARNQMGAVIIGGMLIGTLLSLFIVPIMYTLLSNDRKTINTQ
ncbi:MAG: multidrug transporter AcrB [Legionellales bacterium]|nr:multidrug transporter AcrB [Legionellales bacterium]